MSVVGGFRALVGAVLSLACVACASGPVDTPAAQAATPALATDYRLGAGDKLNIRVFGEEELAGEYAVSHQGLIAFPLIGAVEAGGVTTDQLAARISERLQQGFVREPRVSVEVAEYRPFYILGEVNTPGAYPYTPNLTVMSAVATAGGFTYRASQSRVHIKHPGQPLENTYPLTGATPVQPGDTVRIAERFF